MTTTISLETGAALKLDRDQLLAEIRDIEEVILATVGAEDQPFVVAAMQAIVERTISFTLKSPGVTQPPADLAQAIAAGQRAGIQQGARAGYAKGVSDGRRAAEAARPAPEPTPVYDFVRDEHGRVIEVIETRGEKVIRKVVEHDANGRTVAVREIHGVAV